MIPEHQTYVEAFAGGAALFFAKERSPFEVLNDRNSGLVNLLEVIADSNKFQRFQLKVEIYPYSREEFEYCRDNWGDGVDDVERAARYFVAMRQSFNGVGKSWSRAKHESARGMSRAVSKYLSAVEALPEISQRLKTVQIENRDFRQIIKDYDHIDAFFYLDPPYIADTRLSPNVYEHEMTNEDHEELVDLLLRIKGKAMLSGYAHPIYGPLECAGWKRTDMEVKCTSGASTFDKTGMDKATAEKRMERTETVWLKC